MWYAGYTPRSNVTNKYVNQTFANRSAHLCGYEQAQTHTRTHAHTHTHTHIHACTLPLFLSRSHFIFLFFSLSLSLSIYISLFSPSSPPSLSLPPPPPSLPPSLPSLPLSPCLHLSLPPLSLPHPLSLSLTPSISPHHYLSPKLSICNIRVDNLPRRSLRWSHSVVSGTPGPGCSHPTPCRSRRSLVQRRSRPQLCRRRGCRAPVTTQHVNTLGLYFQRTVFLHVSYISHRFA